MSETPTAPLQFDSIQPKPDTIQKLQPTPAPEPKQLTKQQLSTQEKNTQIICAYCDKPITEAEAEIGYLLAVESDKTTLLDFLYFHGTEYPAELRLDSCKNGEYQYVSISCGELAAKSHKIEKKFGELAGVALATRDDSTELIVGSIAGKVCKILDEMLQFTQCCVVSDAASRHAEKIHSGCTERAKRVKATTEDAEVAEHQAAAICGVFGLAEVEQFFSAYDKLGSTMVHMVHLDEVKSEWVTNSSLKKPVLKKKPVEPRADVRNFVLRSINGTVVDNASGVVAKQKIVELKNVPTFMLNYVTATDQVFFRLLLKLCAGHLQHLSWMAERLIERLDKVIDPNTGLIADPFTVMKRELGKFEQHFLDIKETHRNFEEIRERNSKISDCIGVKELVEELRVRVFGLEQVTSGVKLKVDLSKDIWAPGERMNTVEMESI